MTERRPAVSVIIATYNMAEHLGQAIESVLGQTHTDLELIVIDDGSTDQTESLTRKYTADPRFIYARQSNLGQAAAKNHGVKISRGKFIGFCDADDYWKPHKSQVQLEALAGDDDVGVVHTRIAQTRNGVEEYPLNKDLEFAAGNVTETLFVNNYISFGSAMVRRECFETLGGFDEKYRMGIDWELWLRFSTRYRFKFVDDITYVYRIWERQMSNDWRGRYKFTFQIMQDFLVKFPDAVTARVINQAYAHSYVQRGRLRSSMSNEHLAGICDVIRGIRYQPGSFFAWKSLVRIMLNAARTKNPDS